MDHRDLKAASKYVNNLLAARGLLRGKEIAFYKPADDESTPSKIINLVHELLTRRDVRPHSRTPLFRLLQASLANPSQKEQEQHESLALTLHTLRSTEDKQTETIQQLKTKNASLERKNALLESAQRNFTSTLRTTEETVRQLKDEATRIRTTLSQVRTQCANDIRKRDVQIQKMKERLSDSVGRGARPPMAQCTVIGASDGSAAEAVEDSPTLAQETSDFLTELSQSLADENDNLIALVRTTLSTLKAIQGLPDDNHFLPADLPAETEFDDGANPVIAPPANFDDLTAELDNTLYSLKGVLNQPNYVPLEDLAERDAEIERLIAKNKTLEEEWRKAIELVDGWNRTLGAKFAEVTQEEGKSPKKTPGKGKGRALADIIYDRGRKKQPEEPEEREEQEEQEEQEQEQEQEEQEGETVVVMGRREIRSDLSIVQEEVEDEDEEEYGEEEEEEVGGEGGSVEVEAEEEEEETPDDEEEEEAVPEVRRPSVGKGKELRLWAEAFEPAARGEIAPQSRSTSPKKDKRKQTGATQNGTEAEEAAVSDQILAEVHGTPTAVLAKTPRKTPRMTPVQKGKGKGKRKVRISDAAPEMFSADELSTDAEEVPEVHEKAGQTPGRNTEKKKSGKKDVQSRVAEAAHEEEPQNTSIREGRRTRSDSLSGAVHEPIVILDDELVPEVQQPSVRKRGRPPLAVPEKQAVPDTQVPSAKKDKKRKATVEASEDTNQDSVIVRDASQGRERKRRAWWEGAVAVRTDAIIEAAEPQMAPRGRDRWRKPRKEDVALEADTTGTAGDTSTVTVRDEEPVPEPLVLGRKERKRRNSRARTDMDELLEFALTLPPEPEPKAAAVVQELPRRRESRSRAREEDESIAEDTFARLATREGSTAETPKRGRRPSRSRKETYDDSAMLDELAAEPVLLRYEEVKNQTRTVGVKNHEDAGGKLGRARRRSLRNVSILSFFHFRNNSTDELHREINTQSYQRPGQS